MLEYAAVNGMYMCVLLPSWDGLVWSEAGFSTSILSLCH